MSLTSPALMPCFIASANMWINSGFGRRRAEQEGAAPNKEAQRFDQDTARRGERAADSGRGRAADTPSEIPARGWKDILLRVYHGISEDRILPVGAVVTFYFLLSIFP